MDTNKKRTRHGRNRCDTIKLSCKVDYYTWRRVTKAAEESDAEDCSAYLRRIITEAVWQIPLTVKDYEIIEAAKARKMESGK